MTGNQNLSASSGVGCRHIVSRGSAGARRGAERPMELLSTLNNQFSATVRNSLFLWHKNRKRPRESRRTKIASPSTFLLNSSTSNEFVNRFVIVGPMMIPLCEFFFHRIQISS